MEKVLYGLGCSVFIYLLYLLLIISNERRLNKFINKGKECQLIKGRFKINFDKVDKKMVANLFAIDNALILGITFSIVLFVKNFILKLLFAFLIFTFLITFTYLQIGKFVKNKEVK